MKKLIGTSRYAEAEALLELALAQSPDDRRLLTQYATCAHNRGHYAVAQERWERLRHHHPEADCAWSGVTANARARNDIGYARTVIVEALSRFPSSTLVIGEAARVFERDDEPAEAVVQWRRLFAMVDPLPEWYARYAKCLLRLERFDEAEAAIAAGMKIDAGYAGLEQTRGLFAMARENWDEALSIWSALAATCPDDPVPKAYVLRVGAIKALAEAESSHQGWQGTGRQDVPIPTDTMREAMLRFEGIGIDCEFGTIQRHYGAEPLGLLRWNDTTCRALMAALAAGFEGIGEPANTELTTGQFGEYYLRDKRWGLDMHTCLYSHEMAAETLFPKMCRRMSYLRDKFLEDLTTGDKILVYKSEEGLEEIIALHDAFKAFGRAPMLNVRLAADDRRTRGELRSLRPDLHVGFVERIGDLNNIPYDDWKRICLARLGV